jgi:DNA primase
LPIFIPEDKISEIKNAADIVDIISETVLLKKAGRNFIGLCPFHSEKTPSFTVSPEKQIFYCFGCGAGGNVFSYLMKHESLSFPEAARALAKRYGITIPAKTLSPEQRRKIDQKESLLDLNKQAMEFFRHELLSGVAGQQALSYLSKRGISRETMDRFNLGYAPKGWDNLVRFFAKKRIPPALVEISGLVAARKNSSGFYDRFRDRIIFPIFDVNMEVVGFGGRVLDHSEPKYLNSPETPVYNKSRTLYGLHRAKEKCRADNKVFIVEGYLDLLALHQHGIENSVATLGTALTAEHIRMLARYTRRMVLVYDSDEAGIKSAYRCIETFWREHVDFQREDVFKEEKADTQILVLADGHDPDSYLSEFGLNAFMEAASRAPGMVSFLIDFAIKKHGLSTEGKIQVVSELQQPLAAINDSVARSLYVKQLAERIDIDESIVLEKIREVASGKSRSYSDRMSSPVSTRPVEKHKSSGLAGKGSKLEQKIIAMMLQFPEILSEIEKRRVLDYFENDTLKSIGATILSRKLSSADRVSELLNLIDNPEEKCLVAALVMTDEPWEMKRCIMLISQFVEGVMKRRDHKLLDDKIKAAEIRNDHKMLAQLLNEKQKLAVRSEKQKMALIREK